MAKCVKAQKPSCYLGSCFLGLNFTVNSFIVNKFNEFFHKYLLDYLMCIAFTLFIAISLDREEYY